MSDPAIREYCETIDWENMTIIARSGPACIDAAVILASLPPAHTTAKLSLACPLSGNQAPVVRELLDLAIDVAALRFRKLIGGRELANPALLALLRENQTARFNCEHIEIHLDVAMENVGWLKSLLPTRRPPRTIRETIVQKFFQRAMPKGDRNELLSWLVGLIALYGSSASSSSD